MFVFSVFILAWCHWLD